MSVQRLVAHTNRYQSYTKAAINGFQQAGRSVLSQTRDSQGGYVRKANRGQLPAGKMRVGLESPHLTAERS
jgi:hypothetical protein